MSNKTWILAHRPTACIECAMAWELAQLAAADAPEEER